MTKLARLLLAVLPVAALLVFAGPAAASRSACESIAAPVVPGARVLSVAGVERRDFTVPPGPLNPEPITDIPAFCEAVVTLTHAGADDVVTVEVWLPLDTWNRRFQGVGGGGFAAGFFDPAMAAPVQAGYAAASTDAGVPGFIPFPTWASDPELVTNFSSRSLHDMAVAGKALTASFYGRPAAHTYWNGCSTGGRQGLMSAQRYPKDYDGILAAAPAINWTKFVVAEQWPQVVMRQEGNRPTDCELQAFADAAVASCDGVDKVADGVIGDPRQCRYDPYRLVGKTIECEGQQVTITRSDAEVVARIWAGPGVWSGLPKGTPFYGIAGQTPFEVSDSWIKYFLKKDPTFDTSTITYRDWYRLYAQSDAEYGDIIGTDDPDLSAFRAEGGKMVTWHGEADELIFPTGTIDYRARVDRTVPGKVDDFYRLFMAPGVGHCAGGVGPAPTDPLAAVVDWVEKGRAPEVLPATAPSGATRNLCRYPLVSRYEGGDPASASSFRCARSY